MDTRLALMTGCDYPIPECQLTLHQPTIKEIGLIGDKGLRPRMVPQTRVYLVYIFLFYLLDYQCL